jgi:outer membrane protein assembly factor BamA
MWRRGYLPFTLACTVCVLLCSSPISAQISRRLDRCLPYPSLADEIDDMREEVREKIATTQEAMALRRTIVIDDVKFDGPTPLPEATRERFVAWLKQGTFDDESGWSGYIDGPVRDAWQDDGFLKAQLTATASAINTNSTVEHVVLTVHADNGHQYESGGIQFRSSDSTFPLIFSSTELRDLFQMHEGDILRAHKIREALDAVRKLYGSHGYIDIVTTLITNIDDETGRMSLVTMIDQGQQYRIGKVEVFGPNPQMENLLKSTLKLGEIYNDQILRNFLKEHKSSLPSDVSFEDIDFHRNVRTGTVDLRFNFQTCPQVQQ